MDLSMIQITRIVEDEAERSPGCAKEARKGGRLLFSDVCAMEDEGASAKLRALSLPFPPPLCPPPWVVSWTCSSRTTWTTPCSGATG